MSVHSTLANGFDKTDDYAHNRLLDKAETLKTLIKARHLAARVDELRTAPCPGRMS